MGTKGIYGFYYKGVYYLFYNHDGSYPSGLGAKLIKEIRKAILEGNINEWKSKLLALKAVNYNDEPTKDDIEKLREYTDLRVSGRSTSDWYCLLRKCQGSYLNILNAGYYVYPGRDLFSEQYSYVLNFDTNKFECYAISDKIGEYSLNELPNFSDF